MADTPLVAALYSKLNGTYSSRSSFSHSLCLAVLNHPLERRECSGSHHDIGSSASSHDTECSRYVSLHVLIRVVEYQHQGKHCLV